MNENNVFIINPTQWRKNMLNWANFSQEIQEWILNRLTQQELGNTQKESLADFTDAEMAQILLLISLTPHGIGNGKINISQQDQEYLQHLIETWDSLKNALDVAIQNINTTSTPASIQPNE